MHPLATRTGLIAGLLLGSSGTATAQIGARVPAVTVPVGSEGVERSGGSPPENGGTLSVPLVSITFPPQPMLANLGDEYRSVRLSPDSEAYDSIQNALAQHHEDLVFIATPLLKFVAQIAEKSGVRVAVDTRALEDLRRGNLGMQITGNFAGVSLKAGLRQALDSLGLTYIIKDESLLITTAEEADKFLESYFYPVVGGTDVYDLIDMLENTVAGDTWMAAGGRGTIEVVPQSMGNGLVISQTPAVHEQIDSVVRGLDKLLWTAEFGNEAKVPLFLRSYHIADDPTRTALVEHLVRLCNGALPQGADPSAKLTVIGESIVVESKSRSFQIMAAQLLATLKGVNSGTNEVGTNNHPHSAAPQSKLSAKELSVFAAISEHVGRAASLTLYEGLPHQAEGAVLKRELATKKTVRLYGYPFYERPLIVAAGDVEHLRKLSTDQNSWWSFGGGKFCGGFHPDYCLAWRDGDATYCLLICFGCQELKLYGPTSELLVDIRDGAYKAFATVLKKYRGQRPASKLPVPQDLKE